VVLSSAVMVIAMAVMAKAEAWDIASPAGNIM